MRALARDFYFELFTSQGVANMDRILDNIHVCVSDNMNNELGAPISDKEIERALF